MARGVALLWAPKSMPEPVSRQLPVPISHQKQQQLWEILWEIVGKNVL